MLTLTDGENGTTTFSYDFKGRLTRMVNPEAEATDFTYHWSGAINWQRDPSGNEASLYYNGNGKLVATLDAAGGVTVNTYDAEDRLTRITDPTGRTTEFDYYANGWLKSVSKGGGIMKTNFEYDAAGNLISETVKRRFEYDARNRRVAWTDAGGNRSTITLDGRGLPQQLTDMLGRITTYNHDARGILSGVIAPGSVSASFDLDAEGATIGTTRPGGARTSLTRDLAGRVTRKRTALGRETVMGYDRRDLLVSIAEPSRDTTSFGYDAAGRPASRADGIGTTTYGYNDAGQLETVSLGGKTIRRTYDALGRVTRFEDGEGNTLRYDYDGAGRLTKLYYPDNKEVTYTYDAAGRLSTITDWASRVTTCTYDSRGRLSGIDRPNGTTTRYFHDGNDRLVFTRDETAPGGLIVEERLRWDAAGQLSARSLDPLPDFPEPWAFKATFDADDAPDVVQGGPLDTDLDGNLLTAPFPSGTASLAYDARNRLVSASGISYAYDAEDRRISTTTSGSGATRFVMDPHAPLSRLLVSTAPNGEVTRYVYGPGLLYEERNGQIRCYHYDHLGSTLAITDASGAVTSRISYSEYGQITSQTGTPDTPFLFHGRHGIMTDPNGLLHMRARYYHPWLCRFLTEDPAPADSLRPASINRYAFLEGRVMSGIDPLGLSVYMLNDVDAVASQGHAAALVGSGDSWLFYSFAPNNYLTYVDNLTTVPFSTIDEAKKYIISQGYDRFIRFEASTDSDYAAVLAAEQWSNVNYNLAGVNCGTMVEDMLLAAGFPISKAETPNALYVGTLHKYGNRNGLIDTLLDPVLTSHNAASYFDLEEGVSGGSIEQMK